MPEYTDGTISGIGLSTPTDPRDFGDADVWRAVHKALHEVMTAATLGEKRVRNRLTALLVKP